MNKISGHKEVSSIAILRQQSLMAKHQMMKQNLKVIKSKGGKNKHLPHILVDEK